MKLNKAKELFEQIVELCYNTENPRLIEVVESIYSEVNRANSISKVYSSCQEIIVAINEQDFNDDEQDLIMEIEELIENLLEE